MKMILFEEKDLLDITRDALEKFGDASLKSEATKEAIARKIVEGVREDSKTIDGEEYMSKHEN